MTSKIVPSSIDGTYPIAGQDNNSQGFRTNFTSIKNNFEIARSEIETLQNSALLKTPIGPVDALYNDMAGGQISSALIRNFREKIQDYGAISVGTQPELKFSDGSFQILTIGDDIINFKISDWPASGYARMRALMNLSVDHSIELYSGASWVLEDTIVTSLNLSAGTYILEFSTYDAGNTIYILDLYRPLTTKVSYQFANLTVSTDIVASTTVSSIIIDSLNGASSTTANINLPDSTVLGDGHVYTIVSNVGITTANVIAGDATTIGGHLSSWSSSWTANSKVTLTYVSSRATWYKS